MGHETSPYVGDNAWVIVSSISNGSPGNGTMMGSPGNGTMMGSPGNGTMKLSKGSPGNGTIVEVNLLSQVVGCVGGAFISFVSQTVTLLSVTHRETRLACQAKLLDSNSQKFR